MKQHLNTLFITSPGVYLSKDGQSVLIRQEKEVKLRVPVHTLAGIVSPCSSARKRRSSCACRSTRSPESSASGR